MSIPGAASPLLLATTGEAAPFSISRSLRFNSGDSAYLNRTPSSASNRKTFTFSAWIKKVKNDSGNNFYRIFGQSESCHLYFYQDRFVFDIADTGNSIGSRQTSAVFRDNSAWLHVVAVCNTPASTAGERMRLYVNGVEITAFNASSNPSQNADTSMNTTNIHTIGYRTSAQGGAGGALDAYLAEINFVDGAALDPTSFGAFDANGVWQAKDTAGLTFGTNGFRLKFADNSGSTATTLGKDTSGNSNNWTPNNLIGAPVDYVTGRFTGTERSGFEWKFLFDGITTHGAVPSINGNFVWTPASSIAFTTLAVYAYKDSSPGNLEINGTSVISQIPNHGGIGSNQRTVITGISSPLTSLKNISLGSLANVVLAGIEIDGVLLQNAETDCFVDTPTNAAEPSDSGIGGEIVGNYCTLNPIDNGTGKTYSDGNLKVTDGGSGANSSYGTLAVSSGKWYWEIESGGVQGEQIGFADANASSGRSGNGANGWVYEQAGRKVNNNSYTSYGTSYADGDIIGIALNIDAGEVTFYKNGASQGVAFTGLSGKTLQPLIERASGYGMAWTCNFGQRAFAHPLSSNPIYSQSVSGAVAGSPYDATKMFDGSLTTYADHNAQNSTITWTYTLTGVTSLRVYIHEGSSTGTVTTVGGNGTQTDTISANFGPGWHTISLSSTGSTINSIAFTRGGSGNPLEIYAIEVNGTVLVEGAGAIYKSLNTANLPTPTIADGSKYFDTKLYSGTGSAQSITMDNSALSPDFVWIKNRNANGSHDLYDIVRGADAVINSDATHAEYSGSGRLTAFGSNGFTLGSQSAVNISGGPFVSWVWDAGTSTVTNNDGSIASQVRAQPSAGFSICTYTGAGSGSANSDSGESFGHGLNAKPELVIAKKRSGANSWPVYHGSTALGALVLDGTNALDTSSYLFAKKHPSSSVVYLGNNPEINANNSTYVAYCFAPVAGYSAMGSFSGAGSSGPFVFTGMRPSWVLIKRSDNTGNWTIWDTARQDYNAVSKQLFANTSGAEQDLSVDAIDVLSNGFMVRSSSSFGGGTFLYVAFASNPFQANGGLAR
nr:hypothetical protein [uncultured Mediterranean phage uvMED]